MGSEAIMFAPTQNVLTRWRLESIPELRRARNDISIEVWVLEDREHVFGSETELDIVEACDILRE